MIDLIPLARSSAVVPRKGDVDRNDGGGVPSILEGVVPRKGDVDRNFSRQALRPTPPVVPRKGDVDRNEAGGDLSDLKIDRRPPQGGRG